jgi:hypothetical protein
MSKSLSFRFKSDGKKEIRLTAAELKRRFAYRPRWLCDRYYKVDDVRHVIDEDSHSLDAKIRIVSTDYCPRMQRIKIIFKKINEYNRTRTVEVK